MNNRSTETAIVARPNAPSALHSWSARAVEFSPFKNLLYKIERMVYQEWTGSEPITVSLPLPLPPSITRPFELILIVTQASEADECQLIRLPCPPARGLKIASGCH